MLRGLLILTLVIACERAPDPEIAAARPSPVVSVAVAVEPQPSRPPSPSPPAAVPERPWYSGGTLHTASALEWQKADAANKLATAADLVVAMKEKGALKPSLAVQLHSLDAIRVRAAALVVAIDKATVGDADPEKNRRLLANQTVPGLAVTLAAAMGWLG